MLQDIQRLTNDFSERRFSSISWLARSKGTRDGERGGWRDYETCSKQLLNLLFEGFADFSLYFYFFYAGSWTRTKEKKTKTTCRYRFEHIDALGRTGRLVFRF